jgi:hypothetical protein
MGSDYFSFLLFKIAEVRECLSWFLAVLTYYIDVLYPMLLYIYDVD